MEREEKRQCSWRDQDRSCGEVGAAEQESLRYKTAQGESGKSVRMAPRYYQTPRSTYIYICII